MTAVRNSDTSITEVDLALFAEGLLGIERKRQVLEFLKQHPELCEFAMISDVRDADESQTVDVADDEFEPPASYERVDVSNRTQSLPPVSLERPSWIRSRQTQWVVAGLTLMLGISVGAWGIRDARAIELTLSETEGNLLSTNPALSPKVRESREALERLSRSMWLSGENRQRQERLLATIDVTQAKLELGHHNQTDFAENPELFPPLQLCDHAIQLVVAHDPSDHDSRRILVESYYLRGRIYYLFGTLWRADGETSKSSKMMRIAADSLLTGLEVLPSNSTEFHRLKYLQLGGLLAKSFHKGALTDLNDDALSGRLSRIAISDRTAKIFPGLTAASPDQSLGPVVEELCEQLLRLAPVTPEETVAILNIYNTLGLRRKNSNVDHTTAISTLLRGVELVELNEAFLKTNDHLFVYGQLLGNLADACSQNNDLDGAIFWGQKAIAVFRQTTFQQRDEESIFELGWATSRHLISNYRWSARHPNQRPQFEESLGALLQISNGLSSFRGFQLSDLEIELISAIYADTHNDPKLGKGLASILRNAYSKDATESGKRSLLLLLLDFQNNRYLQSFPEFAGALNDLSR